MSLPPIPSRNFRRKIVMLGSAPRTQRSLSSVQLPVNLETASQAVPVFSYRTSEFIYDLRAVSNQATKSDQQKLKEMLMSRWESAKSEGVFNYHLNCMYKFLPGDFNFSIQLNVERAQMRRKPMRFHAIREAFNSMRWNFTKLKEKEIMFYFRCINQPCSGDPLDRHIVAVNASPLERGHSLIVPSISHCVPQVLNETAVRIAAHFMLLVDDDTFHVLFNSLLGFASVNHLHLHALFWPYDSDLINRRCERISDALYVIRRPVWCTHVIVFQLTSAHDINKFITNVLTCVEFLSVKDVAHNVYFARAQPLRTTGEIWSEDTKRTLPQLVTAYIFPRTSVLGAKPVMNFSPAALELAGCLTAYSYRFFESATEETALRIMDEDATISDSLFNQLYSELDDILCGRKPVSKQCDDIDAELELTSPELEELRDSFETFEMHSPRRFYSNEKPNFDFPPPPSPLASAPMSPPLDNGKTFPG